MDKKDTIKFNLGDFVKDNIDTFTGANEFDEILERKVSKLGNSGHISIPSKHIGKQARVLIKKESKDNFDMS